LSRFDEISLRYGRDSAAQRGAAEVLLALAPVGPTDDLLDVGCGTGALAALVRGRTSGRVVGVDPSAGMIEAARRDAPAGVELARHGAEELPFVAEFDLVLSNSALQWFRDPALALARMGRALRPGGRLALQAPATRHYCPEFVEAMEEVARDPRTRPTFATFRSPWYFGESADEYARLAEGAGLAVAHARIDELRMRETPDAALRVFGSGAEAGYLDPASHGVALPEGHRATVLEIVSESLARRAGADGRLDLRFRRVFLLARPA